MLVTSISAFSNNVFIRFLPQSALQENRIVWQSIALVPARSFFPLSYTRTKKNPGQPIKIVLKDITYYYYIFLKLSLWVTQRFIFYLVTANKTSIGPDFNYPRPNNKISMSHNNFMYPTFLFRQSILWDVTLSNTR